MGNTRNYSTSSSTCKLIYRWNEGQKTFCSRSGCHHAWLFNIPPHNLVSSLLFVFQYKSEINDSIVILYLWLSDLVFLPQAGVQFPLCELIKALQGGELQMEWRCAVLAGSSLYFGALLTTIFLQAGFCIQFRAGASHWFLWHSSFWKFWNVRLQLNNIKLTKVRLEKLRYTFRNGLRDIKHNVNIKVTVQKLQS